MQDGGWSCPRVCNFQPWHRLLQAIGTRIVCTRHGDSFLAERINHIMQAFAVSTLGDACTEAQQQASGVLL